MKRSTSAVLALSLLSAMGSAAPSLSSTLSGDPDFRIELADATTAPSKECPNGKQTVRVADSIYVTWMTSYYADEMGIYKKWGDKYCLDIQVQHMDYVPSVESFVAGQSDVVFMTNMEALDMPAAAGVDTTVAMVEDYSNDNDQVLTRDGKLASLCDLKGQTVYLAEKTVSQYLLMRGLTEKCGLKESDVNIVNVSDADIAPSFLANKSQKVVVTWNPMVMEIAKNRGIKKLYGSAQIPGEILDLVAFNTKVLKANPDIGRAIIGALYEVQGIMAQRGSASEKAIAKLAQLAKTSVPEYKAQLRTTALFYTPQAALAFTSSDELKAKMDLVRNFCFTHGLLGDNAASVDVVGIEYPDGTIQGDRDNVKLRFTNQFMEEAAAGQLK